MTTEYVYPSYVTAVNNAAGANPSVVPAVAQSTGFAGGWLNFGNTGYLKGFAVGAAAALVLTNPTVQKALVTSVVKIWSAVQGGVEEVKEQIQDVKAEMSQEKE